MKKFISTISVLSVPLVLLVGFFLWGGNLSTTKQSRPANQVTESETVNQPDNEEPKAEEQSNPLPNATLISDIPFTAQSPFGAWRAEPREEDGCEEATILMAAYWAEGLTSLDPTTALDKIHSLSYAAEEMFGTYRDSSAQDTLHLYEDYFGLSGEVTINPSLEDIKRSLAQGRPVGVPLDGRVLNNPHYTAPGPDRHFILIIGYDDETGLFTTHDPGTRWGENWQYAYSAVTDSMINYPTGDHLPLFHHESAMISFFSA